MADNETGRQSDGQNNNDTVTSTLKGHKPPKKLPTTNADQVRRHEELMKNSNNGTTTPNQGAPRFQVEGNPSLKQLTRDPQGTTVSPAPEELDLRSGNTLMGEEEINNLFSSDEPVTHQLTALIPPPPTVGKAVATAVQGGGKTINASPEEVAADQKAADEADTSNNPPLFEEGEAGTDLNDLSNVHGQPTDDGQQIEEGQQAQSNASQEGLTQEASQDILEEELSFDDTPLELTTAQRMLDIYGTMCFNFLRSMRPTASDEEIKVGLRTFFDTINRGGTQQIEVEDHSAPQPEPKPIPAPIDESLNTTIEVRPKKFSLVDIVVLSGVGIMFLFICYLRWTNL